MHVPYLNEFLYGGMNTKSNKCIFFSCLLWLMAVCTYAADYTDLPTNQTHPVAVIDNLDQPLDLAPYIEYFEDPDRTISFEDIQLGRVEERWLRNTAPMFIGKNYKSRYWFRITLRCSKELSLLMPVLYVANQPSLNLELDIWLPENNGDYRQLSTGSLRPYHQRDIDSFRYGFQLSPTETPFAIIGWVDNRNSPFSALLPLKLLSKEQFTEEQFQVQGFMIAFYAVMAALLLYNACLFISLRQPLYGYYLLFLIAAIYLCAVIDGVTLRWLWPTQPLLNYRFISISGIVLALFYLFFVWEALDHLAFSQRGRKGFRVIFWLGVLSLLYNSLTPNLAHANIVNQLYVSAIMPLILITLILAIRKRIPTAGYLLVAETFTILGGSGFILMIQGILPPHAAVLWSMHEGFLAEALLLSLALAARTSLMQQSSIENLQKYEQLYENSIEGLFRYNFQSASLACNDALAKLFGFNSKDELMSNNSGLVNSRASELWSKPELIGPLFENGYLSDYETQILSGATGQEIWVLINMKLIVNEYKKPIAIEGSISNITERKLRQEKEKKYQTIYEQSIQGLSIYYLKDKTFSCNTAWANFFGFRTSDEFIQYHHDHAGDDIFLYGANFSNRELFQRLLVEESVNNTEIQLDNKTDIQKWGLLSFTLQRDLNGEPSSIDCVLVDITDKKLKELAQRQALENLTRSDELKNEFLATMSHELRTPLNGISGYLELLKSTEINADSLTLVNSLEHCSADMLRLIERILDFTQLSAGNFSISTELFDFEQFIEEIAAVYRERCHVKSLNFKFTKGDDLPARIWGDRKKLFVIINDLLDNAVKYTRFGQVDLIVKAPPPKSESIDSNSDIAPILFSIRDTGIGIAIVDRPKIFKAFSQIYGAFNRKYGGLGLGLAMCHEYIKLMNGTLALLSEPGVGSQFDFIVDLKTESQLVAVNTTAQPSQQGTFTPATILVVDDNPTNQLVLKGMLKNIGHNPIVADNGMSALQILQNNQFDLILMDCQMPEMDGFEATQRIRNGYVKQKDIPIIAVTANVMEGDQQRCLDAGMNDYMKKPVRKELLMAMISQWYKH